MRALRLRGHREQTLAFQCPCPVHALPPWMGLPVSVSVLPPEDPSVCKAEGWEQAGLLWFISGISGGISRGPMVQAWYWTWCCWKAVRPSKRSLLPFCSFSWLPRGGQPGFASPHYVLPQAHKQQSPPGGNPGSLFFLQMDDTYSVEMDGG